MARTHRKQRHAQERALIAPYAKKAQKAAGVSVTPKNEPSSCKGRSRATSGTRTKQSNERNKNKRAEKGGDLEAGARGAGDRRLLILIHAGRYLRGDEPLPSLPGHALPPPPRSRETHLENEAKTPNDFRKTTKENDRNFARNRGEEQRRADSGWNWARGLRFGECGGGFERDEQAIARAVLAGVGVFVSRARVYTRREAWGFGSVDLRCGPLLGYK